MLSLLDLKSVDKTFASADGDIPVLKGFSLSMSEGEFLSILGPSGCGKTTILRLLAGLEFPDRGEATFDGKTIAGVPEGLQYLFQSYDCFPWKTVAGNVGIGLLNLSLSTEEYERRISSVLEQVDLTEFRNSYPYQLSGGMRQRVALARTIASHPKVLLLDEPFGAQDLRLRSRLQEFVSDLSARKAIRGIVLTTHDVSEAVRVATRILVLSPRPARIVYETRTKRADDSAPPDEEILSKCREALSTQLLA